MQSDVIIHKNADLNLINKIDEFAGLSGVPPINICGQYILSFDKFLKESWHPLFIEILKQNVTIGILPLMFRNDFRKGVIPYRRIRFFGSTFSDFNCVYGNAGNLETVIEESFDWLFKSGFRWEEMILDDLLDSSLAVNHIHNYLAKKQITFKAEKGQYFYIRLDRPWADVINGMSKSFVLKNIRLAKNRINAAGQWEIIYKPLLNADEILNKASPIHTERQKSLSRESAFLNAETFDFYKAIISYFSGRDQFQTFWLNLRGKPIAYMLGFCLDKTFYWWNTAFNPDFSGLYPSRFLQYHVLEYMHQNGYNEFNFMRGESGYKDKWTDTTRINWRFRIRNNRTLYGRLLSSLDKWKEG